MVVTFDVLFEHYLQYYVKKNYLKYYKKKNYLKTKSDSVINYFFIRNEKISTIILNHIQSWTELSG